MTFSKNVGDHFPVFPLAWGALWGAPQALLGPLGPHKAHRGRPLLLGSYWGGAFNDTYYVQKGWVY